MNPSISICSNVFPGANWAETQTQLAKSLPILQQELKASTGSSPQLGLDLWLSAQSAHELSQEPKQQKVLRELLAKHETSCEMMNAFPYGEFHGKRVKEAVYQPDWRSPKRLSYTKQCFELLHQLAPAGRPLAVSTLPGSHKNFLPHWNLAQQQQENENEEENEGQENEGQTLILISNLRKLGFWLEDRCEEWQRDLHLGLEPEPFGLFENLPETLLFFERLLDTCSQTQQEILLRRLGINFDSCHFAVQFEEPTKSLNQLQQAGIRISKLHLSNALEIDPKNEQAFTLLRDFDEPVYLHQVIAEFADGSLERRGDLPLALADESLRQAQRWRVHFHLPLHQQASPPLQNTQTQLLDTINWWKNNPHLCEHAAIETYTWAAMPEAIQRQGLESMLAAEYAFVLQQLSA